jgi:DeoR/GlpR family transcriptional regulator of sugar metabolism
MAKEQRLDQIVRLIDERAYVSVIDLSRILGVSEMTIRRDLAQLDEEKRIRRTFGGASRQAEGLRPDEILPEPGCPPKENFVQVDEVDVLIATSVNPYYDELLLDRVGKKHIPIIAESLAMPNQRTVVCVDNYQAGFDLGRATGKYMRQNGFEKANLLDLTFHLTNTQRRSQGFIDGLVNTFPASEVVLTINAQSRAATAYQITSDALAVHGEINLIFAINDSTALGAIRACGDLQVKPEKMVLVTFGLEGDTMRNILMEDRYCKIGLAMFPEIVSLVCIEAAIGAFKGSPLLDEYITPHVVLTSQTLPVYYTSTSNGWRLDWEAVRQRVTLPVNISQPTLLSQTPQPENGSHSRQPDDLVQIGLIVPFSEHEWYQELTYYLKEYADQRGACLRIIDAEQNVQEEVELRRRAIARMGASLVEPGDVILVDGGPIAVYLAEALRHKVDITVITNSMDVFNTLNLCPGIILISTGGAIRYSSQTLVGPTAESALKELRADKLFLTVGGITLDFGLSHTNISEVTVKQAMIRSARQVILLADHTSFSTESIIQVAPLSVVDVLITDDALPPSTRLDLAKSGVRLILAQD